MTGILSLWLPIIVSAVFVFIVSSIIHMVLGYHRSDMPAPPNQDAVRDALRPLALPPGDYMVPRAASMKEMGTPEYRAKVEAGPVVLMTVMPNRMFKMGGMLAVWFGYLVVVSAFAAYVAGNTLPPGTEYLSVFCVVAVVAFAGYGLALVQDSIWWSRRWSTTLKYLFDAAIYALLTAGVFGWLWPGG